MVAIGIDLGTTYSCVGVWNNGSVEIITNHLGKRITPSCVAFNDTEMLIGLPAELQKTRNPLNTVYDVKRLMGRNFADLQLQQDLQRWPFSVVDVGGKPRIQVEYKHEVKKFAPEEISAMVLEKLKETVEKFLDCEVHDAVIAVPAYFNKAQRQATIDAGKIAGLNVLRIINEPTAAALAYGVEMNHKDEKNILIYDFGGGTFDVSIVNIKEGSKIRVLSTTGDTDLGGTDLDFMLAKYLAEEFKKKEEIDVAGNAKAFSKLSASAVACKIMLSTALKVDIFIDALMDGIDFEKEVTREFFENMFRPLIESTLTHVTKALTDAKLKKSDIDDVVLVGGSSRIPLVREVLKKYFPDTLLKETINHDEAIAYGAAIQAAILSGDTDAPDLTFTDITSFALGLERNNGLLDIVIPRNTRLPYSITKSYFTSVDNQDSMFIKVYEGEEEVANKNNLLGSFILEGISRAKARAGTVDVTFDLNDNGILKVTALEKISGKSGAIVIRMEKVL